MNPGIFRGRPRGPDRFEYVQPTDAVFTGHQHLAQINLPPSHCADPYRPIQRVQERKPLPRGVALMASVGWNQVSPPDICAEIYPDILARPLRFGRSLTLCVNRITSKSSLHPSRACRHSSHINILKYRLALVYTARFRCTRFCRRCHPPKIHTRNYVAIL